MYTVANPQTAPLPDFLSHIPQDADQFINVRVTPRFKNRVKRFSQARKTTVTKTMLAAVENYLGMFEAGSL